MNGKVNEKMRECYECGGRLPPGARYCPDCGRDTRTGRKDHQDQAWTAPTAEIEALQKRMYEHDKRQHHKSLGWLLLAVLITAVGFLADYPDGWGIGFIVAFILIMNLSYAERSAMRRGWPSMHDYYALPKSGGSELNHRCVYCGAYGLWRQGAYASNVTYVRCPKCKSALYAY